MNFYNGEDICYYIKCNMAQVNSIIQPQNRITFNILNDNGNYIANIKEEFTHVQGVSINNIQMQSNRINLQISYLCNECNTTHTENVYITQLDQVPSGIYIK